MRSTCFGAKAGDNSTATSPYFVPISTRFSGSTGRQSFASSAACATPATKIAAVAAARTDFFMPNPLSCDAKRTCRRANALYQRLMDAKSPDPTVDESAQTAALPTLLAVIFVNLVGFGIVVPLLPFYAKSFN